MAGGKPRHASWRVGAAAQGRRHPSVCCFDDLLESGIAFGWSESHRRSYDATSYLQRFTRRRRMGTTSARNLRIAERLDREGRMTASGRRALGLYPSRHLSRDPPGTSS